jgi:hypothetical protein
MPLLVVQYDPALDGLNCDSDCSHLALAPMHPAFYGRAAACPLELVGYDVTAVLSHPAIGRRACLDTGGAIVIEYRHVIGAGWLWVVVVDLLERYENGTHPANYSLLWEWTMSWENTAGVVEGLTN